MPPQRRVAAWIYTGPLGHLYATTADIAVAWARWGRTELSARLRARRA
jgi:hypothetical protein